MRLSEKNLCQLPGAVAKPAYDRSQVVGSIVHLGIGAFHRAHQAVYTDILAAEHGSDWGYCEVNLIGGEQQIADLKAQDNLYTVAEMSADAAAKCCPRRSSPSRMAFKVLIVTARTIGGSEVVVSTCSIGGARLSLHRLCATHACDPQIQECIECR